MKKLRAFMARSKLPLLLLVYPSFAWLLSLAEGPPAYTPRSIDVVAEFVRTGAFAVVGFSLAFLLAVPLWASRYRKHPQKLPVAFRRGLYIASGLLAVILPVQGILLCLALCVADPHELWFWGIFVAGGSLFGTLMLLQNEFKATPDIYLSLWASCLEVRDHPKLEAMLGELCEAFEVSLPRHILVGLQPELMAAVGTVFCPEGELDGGTLCFSLPTSSILSINEFRFLTGQALLELHAGASERRKDFLSTFEVARDVLNNLDESMREWSWLPKGGFGFHPFFFPVRLVAVAAMRFPLYLGREWITFYVREVCSVRQAADIDYALRTHRTTTGDVGAVQAVAALIKEAAVSLGLRFDLSAKNQTWPGLGEVARQAFQEHPGLVFDLRAAPQWPDPANSWRSLQFRSNLSGLSLEWCRLQALNVSPLEPALSLFEDPASLEASLLEAAKTPFV